MRTNWLKSCRFNAILKFHKGISTIQGICFTFKTYNDRTNKNKVRISDFTMHEILIMSTYQKCKAAFFHETLIMSTYQNVKQHFFIYTILGGYGKFLNEDNTRTLVNAFVTSRLDY